MSYFPDIEAFLPPEPPEPSRLDRIKSRLTRANVIKGVASCALITTLAFEGCGLASEHAAKDTDQKAEQIDTLDQNFDTTGSSSAENNSDNVRVAIGSVVIAGIALAGSIKLVSKDKSE